ncbi:hypothetical protein Tco_0121751 [Tanacetum coccineum]
MADDGDDPIQKEVTNSEKGDSCVCSGSEEETVGPSMECMNNLQDVKAVDARDSIQKAKIQWAVEGDENSNRVKDEFRNHFAAKFQDPGICHGKINFSFPNRLNHEQSTELESSITREEIRNAVWGCGENKSPGPDGFTFEFFRKFWAGFLHSS